MTVFACEDLVTMSQGGLWQWDYISANFIIKLPLAQGYNAILVVCDHLTKITHFIATTEKTLAEGLIKLIRDHIWKLHRLPESIVLDKGIMNIE